MFGILGGTGLYAIEGLEIKEEHEITTPLGKPSAPVVESYYKDNQIFFIPRHGNNHEFLPHEVNYRANIFALKSFGVTNVIGVSAAGSLREEIKPGDFSIPDQYFDFVKGNRERTFFGNGLAGHISTAEPVCNQLTQKIVEAAKSLDISVHTKKTYACVDGPRLGTRAESFFLRGPAGCDLVGMTNVPEAFLAREAQMRYVTLTIATDYDCWLDDPAQHVSVEMVFARYGESLDRAKKLLKVFFEKQFEMSDCPCRHALETAIITPVDALTDENREMLAVLQK
jgi:5'-methylthioadenosine phosphorylase